MATALLQRTPENVLLATLYKVGRDTRLIDNEKLARIFNDAALSSDLFKRFAWNVHYHVSDRLNEALQTLDQAGSIVRENAAQTYFRASEHTAGPYGRSVYEALPESDRALVDKVAEMIGNEFRDGEQSR